MKAMLLTQLSDLRQDQAPLKYTDVEIPTPGPDEILLKVSVCGVCHTELDEIEGRTAPPKLPVIPGHQVIGTVEALGADVHRYSLGDRLGVAWIYAACGQCSFCLSEQENLCPDFQATGRDHNGGYAQYMVVPESFAYPIPAFFPDAAAAPLLCAGAIGYRSLRLSGLKNGSNLGLTGFGASGHLVLKMAQYRYPQARIFVYARSSAEREFARELGAHWAGDIDEHAPSKMQAIIDTTPAWRPIINALENLHPGGRLIINAIRKEGDVEHLLEIDYPRHLWMEKEIKSIANITRRDVTEFLSLAAEMKLAPEIEEYPLKQANQALLDLKFKQVRGAKVLRI